MYLNSYDYCKGTLCDWFENERRFVEKGQMKDWFDDRKMEQILHQVPVQLKREAEYEQQSLFL